MSFYYYLKWNPKLEKSRSTKNPTYYIYNRNWFRLNEKKIGDLLEERNEKITTPIAFYR